MYPLPEIEVNEAAIPLVEEKQPAKYRHPRSTGSVAAQLRALRESDAPKNTTVKVTAAPAYKPPVAKQNRDPPGYVPGYLPPLCAFSLPKSNQNFS